MSLVQMLRRYTGPLECLRESRLVNASVLSSLLPVVLLIAVGLVAARAQWIRPEATKDLSNLVFLVLTPALLFRTMSTVRVQQLELAPVAVYFVSAALLFALVWGFGGRDRRATVLALASTYSNLVMVGIPLVGLAFGEAGLVTLFTLISMHALFLLTLATIVLELVVAREQAGQGGAPERHMAHTVWLAVRNSVIHPVPLPIILGLLFAQTSLRLPAVLDKALQWMGQAFGPLALILVGITLASTRIHAQWRGALALALAKNAILPGMVLLAGWLLGMRGLPLTVMAVAAAMPIGANVFLFSQRYGVAQDLITASVAVSTVLGLVTISAVMMLAGQI